MINPLRSEEDAFRFTVVVAVLLAPVVARRDPLRTRAWRSASPAAWRSGRVRAGRAASATAARAGRSLRRQPDDDRHRILVVANETLSGAALRDEIEHRAAGQRDRGAGRLPGAQHARSSTGPRTRTAPARSAHERLETILDALEREGFTAEGDIGDGDPVQAMEDALRAVPRRRGDHLDAPARPLELARARRGRARARALRRPGHARGRGPRARAEAVPRAARRLRYLTVSVPFIPACSWPGTLQ